MTNRELHSLLTYYRLAKKQAIHSSRSFPSRRTAKSTSHGNLNNPDKKAFRVIPGVGLETQLKKGQYDSL